MNSIVPTNNFVLRKNALIPLFDYVRFQNSIVKLFSICRTTLLVGTIVSSSFQAILRNCCLDFIGFLDF